MSSKAKLLFGVTMTAAFLFGFMHPIWPEALFSFKRLHIFLFNLVAGGTLILYFTEGRANFGNKVKIYFGLSFLYALFAAAKSYVPAIAISIPLLTIVESVRIRRFGVFPADFFKNNVPAADKFNQASLLCLSIGIGMASLVIVNNEYLHLVVGFNKLTLDVFFLGYSFPVSLITMSVMFSFMTEKHNKIIGALKEIGFWFVNLGVIVFFVFIIFEKSAAEMIVSTVLFFTVFMIFFVFTFTAPKVQQRTFLISGMAFLLSTALTGIFYLLCYFFPYMERYAEYLMTWHAMVSLYGWNLSGLFIIVRWSDFPIKLNSALAISLHWTIVLLLAPVGKYAPPAAFFAMFAWVALLAIVFAGRAGSGNICDEIRL